MRNSDEKFQFRKKRVRNKISGNAQRPRLNIYRGHRNIYAQLIDDVLGVTLVSASTLSSELKGKVKSPDTIEGAKAVATLIAKKALEKGLNKVVFDRSGNIYHGRVKAFAEAARAAGLEF